MTTEQEQLQAYLDRTQAIREISFAILELSKVLSKKHFY